MGLARMGLARRGKFFLGRNAKGGNDLGRWGRKKVGHLLAGCSDIWYTTESTCAARRGRASRGALLFGILERRSGEANRESNETEDCALFEYQREDL